MKDTPKFYTRHGGETREVIIDGKDYNAYSVSYGQQWPLIVRSYEVSYRHPVSSR
jgi:hypothetical protein